MLKTGPVEAVYEQLVPFHDCDPLGIVWHGHYYKYFEIARVELFRKHRLEVRDFIGMGLKLVIIESRCRHASPLHDNERLKVRAWFKDYEQRLNVCFEVTNETRHKRAARGSTILVPLRDDEMLLETPSEIIERIEHPAQP